MEDFKIAALLMLTTLIPSASSTGTTSALVTLTTTSTAATSSASDGINSALGSSSTSTAPNSSPTIVQEEQFHYVVPFTGFGDSDSDIWGVSVINQADPAPPQPAFNEIIVNNSTYLPSSGFTECNETPNVLVDAITEDGRDAAPLITYPSSEGISPLEERKLIVGLNSPLEVELSNPQECTSIYLVETVPLGINLGRYGFWNGSITFQGLYDANRIASTSWFLVPESANGNSTFL